MRTEKQLEHIRKLNALPRTAEWKAKISETQIAQNLVVYCGYKYEKNGVTYVCRNMRLRADRSCRGKYKVCIHHKYRKSSRQDRYFPHRKNHDIVLDITL